MFKSATEKSGKKSDRSFPPTFTVVLMPIVITAVCWLTSGNDITITQGIIGFLLLLVPWWSYNTWASRKQQDLPLFAMIAFMYWLYFALPLFWSNHFSPRWDIVEQLLPSDTMTAAISMALAGVAAIWLGMKANLGHRLVPKRLPDININIRCLHYLRFLLIFGCLIGLYEPFVYLAGAEARQIMIVLQSIIPMTAFAIMFRLYLRGHAKPIDKFILVVFVMMRVIVGMYSGWIGMTAAFVITSAAVYISERRKVPYLVLGALVIFVLFFQAGKEDYRQYYWAKGVEASKAERITGWMNESLLRWEEALTDTTGQTSRDLANISLSRVSLLTQTANVIELTPSMVPYQYGSLYSYFGVTLIPRFVWPDKPSINEANTFYQSAYGIAYENNQTEVSIAVGTLAEGYINFGWLGVVAVMFLLECSLISFVDVSSRRSPECFLELLAWSCFRACCS